MIYFVFILRETGLLVIQSHPRKFFNESLATMKRDNISYSILNGGGSLKDRFPALCYDDKHVALDDPSAAVLRANKCLKALQVYK